MANTGHSVYPGLWKRHSVIFFSISENLKENQSTGIYASPFNVFTDILQYLKFDLIILPSVANLIFIYSMQATEHFFRST